LQDLGLIQFKQNMVVIQTKNDEKNIINKQTIDIH